jgi:hypothetical protein
MRAAYCRACGILNRRALFEKSENSISEKAVYDVPDGAGRGPTTWRPDGVRSTITGTP